MSKTILIMAGGTGGHIFPALAVADALRTGGWRVVWLGNPDGMEARIVPEHGYPLVPVRFAALRGRAWQVRLFEALQQLADPVQEGRLKLSFEIIYGHAIKPQRRLPVAEQTTFSLDDMRAQLRQRS